MLSKQDVVTNFATNVERIRIAMDLSQSDMAVKLGLSLSGYKRIISGQTERLDLYVVYLLHEMTGKYMFELIEANDRISHVIPLIRQLSQCQLNFVESVIDFELQYQPPDEISDYISVLNLTGDLYDGMIYDSSAIEKVNASSYRRIFGDDLLCGIRVSSHHLAPVYNYGDIILIGSSPIRDGDTGVFIHKQTNRAYLRKLMQSCRQLVPLNGFGKTFDLDVHTDDIHQWIFYGRVLAKMRTHIANI